MIKKISRNEARKARHSRIRTKLSGTSDSPRLSVLDQISKLLLK